MEDRMLHHIMNREQRRAERHRDEGPWKLPVASPYDVAFAIKAASRPRSVDRDHDLRALAAIGAAATWLADDDLRTIAAATQTPIGFLRDAVARINRWLAGIEDYVARCDRLGVASPSRAGRDDSGDAPRPAPADVRGRSGVTTAVVLAGDDIYLAPWALSHAIIAGTRCVAVSVRPEPLSPSLFVRAAVAAGVTACPELVYLDRDGEADRKALRTLLESTRQSVMFGGDRFVTATYGAGPALARHRAIPYWNGRCTAVVLPDADLDRAAAQIIAGAVEGRGNRCLSTKKVLVAAGQAAALESRLLAYAERVRRGDVLDPDTELCPPEPAALRAGHAVAARGELVYDRDLVIVRCGATASLLKEDLSCPMLIVAPFADEAEAIAAANHSVADSDPGAATVVSVFTEDPAAFERIAGQLLAFKVRHNRPTSEFELTATHQGRHLYLELMARVEFGG